jgi:truncated hemoglobin YjbI
LKLGEPLYPANSDKEHLMFFSKSIGLPSSKESEYSHELRENKEIREIIE